MQNKRYDVVLIDGGSIRSNESYLTLIDLCKSNSNTNNDFVHGSDVAQIIHKYSPKASILMIKICNTISDFKYLDIFNAFDYLIDNEIKFEIMNLSLGAQFADQHKFKQYIDSFVENGSVVVAANNFETMSHPAFYNNVIGVDVDNSIAKTEQYVYCVNSSINIVGSNNYIRIKHCDGTSINKGSSFIAAYISGILSNYCIEQNINRMSVKLANQFLKEHATYLCEVPIAKRDEGEKFKNDIKKAIVFPFNKETANIAANEDLISFEILGYYDFHISLNNYKYLDELIPNSKHKKVMPYDTIDWSGDFDTIICGHCTEYEQKTRKNILKEIIQKCKSYNKKVYCFDYIHDKNLIFDNLYFPSLEENMVPYSFKGKLYNINLPILAIMGTSSVQGKFGLQLELKRLFEKKGYEVFGISTEPSGYIYNFKKVIPFGYNSKVDLKSKDFIVYVNHTIKEAESSTSDIIMIGSQSGTTPISNKNLDYMCIRQHELLLGANPDAIILCFNYFDSVDYIKKTIRAIEGTVSGKVIALYMSALEYPKLGFSVRNKRNVISLSQNEEKIKYFKKFFNIPIYSMLESKDELLDYIIEYFS